MAFRGHYEHSLDAKNRLSIPARFRAAYASGLVLAKDLEPCISVWTPEAREAMLERALARGNPLNPDLKRLQRRLEGNSFDLELDSAGRVTLPQPLLAHAGIDREVVVAGVGGNLEVWGRDRWAEEQDSLDADMLEVTRSLGDAA